MEGSIFLGLVLLGFTVGGVAQASDLINCEDGTGDTISKLRVYETDYGYAYDISDPDFKGHGTINRALSRVVNRYIPTRSFYNDEISIARVFGYEVMVSNPDITLLKNFYNCRTPSPEDMHVEIGQGEVNLGNDSGSSSCANPDNKYLQIAMGRARSDARLKGKCGPGGDLIQLGDFKIEHQCNSGQNIVVAAALFKCAY